MALQNTFFDGNVDPMTFFFFARARDSKKRRFKIFFLKNVFFLDVFFLRGGGNFKNVFGDYSKVRLKLRTKITVIL